MKNFEKWYNKECKKESNPNVFYGAELGWKAALKMIRDNRELVAWDDVDDIIDKELKE